MTWVNSPWSKLADEEFKFDIDSSFYGSCYNINLGADKSWSIGSALEIAFSNSDRSKKVFFVF
jgi:hypothetical protein